MNEKDRLQNILQAALEFFDGDKEQAKLWMTTPVKGLGNRRPVDMLTTDDEAKIVKDLISRLGHGVFN